MPLDNESKFTRFSDLISCAMFSAVSNSRLRQGTVPSFININAIALIKKVVFVNLFLRENYPCFSLVLQSFVLALYKICIGVNVGG